MAARTVAVKDFDAVLVSLNDIRTLYATVIGSPAVQARPRMNTRNGRVHIYDPSARSKRAFKRAMRQALQELGIVAFPIFLPTSHLKLKATFFLSNEGKDVDNMLKYLMDALQSVVYGNDAGIYDIETKKVKTNINSQFTRFEIEELP
jgi:Holliday junction resolvase RusA-like endonuclease